MRARLRRASARSARPLAPHQRADRDALPVLRAAARGGDYYGPGGLGQFTGYLMLVASSRRSHDAAAQQRLWQVSERLTGVTYHE
jgi:hypothetical protein